MNEELLKSIMLELPNIPDVVCREWLLVSAEVNGWPPSGLFWEGILLKRKLDFWKSTRWSVEQINLEKISWVFDTQDVVEKMLCGFYGDDSSPFGNLRERERIFNLVKYLCKQRAIPNRISLLKVKNSYEIVDGHHRIVALKIFKHIIDKANVLKDSGGDTELITFKDKWGLDEITNCSIICTVWVADYRPS